MFVEVKRIDYKVSGGENFKGVEWYFEENY